MDTVLEISNLCTVYFRMALSHQDLLKCCISILDGFDDDVYAIENRVEDFFSAHEVLY